MQHRLSPSGPYLPFSLKGVYNVVNTAGFISVLGGTPDSSFALSVPDVAIGDRLIAFCSGNADTADGGASVRFDIRYTPPAGVATLLSPPAVMAIDTVYGTYNLAVAPTVLASALVAGTYLFDVLITATGGNFVIPQNGIGLTVLVLQVT